MQHCVHRATFTAVSNWRPAILLNFSTSQYCAYAAPPPPYYYTSMHLTAGLLSMQLVSRYVL